MPRKLSDRNAFTKFFLDKHIEVWNIIVMERENFVKIISQTPKAEIHLHLEDFAAEKCADVNGLSEFLDAYRSAIYSIRSLEDFAIVFHNLVRYMNQNGIVYAEVFFSPTRYMQRGWEYGEMIKFLEYQILLIKKHEGLVIKLIVDVSRSHGVESAEAVLDKVIQHRSKSVIGIGLGGDEKAGPARNFVNIFAKAREHGLRTVAHAGEDDGYISVVDAVELLKAERIGHGIAACEDDATMKLLVEKQIPMEIALTSNITTGKFAQRIEDHPITACWNSGAFITLNTDDPTLFNTSLIDEYWNLYSKLNYDMGKIFTIIVNGFRASFMEPDKKAAYIRALNRKFSRNMRLYKRNKKSAQAGWHGSAKDIFGRMEV